MVKTGRKKIAHGQFTKTNNLAIKDLDLFTVPCVKTFKENSISEGERHNIFAKNFAIMYRNRKGTYEGFKEFAEELSQNQQSFTASDIIGWKQWVITSPKEMNCNELRECLNYLPEFNCENCPLKQSSVFNREVALGPFKLALKANRIYLINDQNEPLIHCKKNKFEQAKFKNEIRKLTKLPLESVSKAIATLSMQMQENLQNKTENFQVIPHLKKEALIFGNLSEINSNDPPDYSIINTEKLRWVFNVNPLADRGYYNIETKTPEAVFTFWKILWSRLDKKLNLLITEPDISIPTRALYMEPIPPNELLIKKEYDVTFFYYPPSYKILMEWVNQLGINKRDSETERKLTATELWQSIIELHILRLHLIDKKKQRFLESPIFWKLKPPLTQETTKKIASWDFEQLIQDYLTEGLQKDKDLVYIFRAKIINILKKIPNDTFTLKNVASQSDGTIIISPTKTSKTYTSEKICGSHHYRNLTESRALGFATADEINPGALDGVVTPVGIDDIHRSGVKYEQLGGLLTMMEDGIASTGKGKTTIITRCAGSLNYYANMKRTKYASALMEDFGEIIKKFTVVAGTLGSRIACIVFNAEMETVKQKTRKEESIEINERKNNKEPEKWVQINMVLIKYLQKIVQPNVKKIWFKPKIQRWLNQSIPWYTQTVKEQLGEEGTFPDDIRNFWIDHAERGYRHVRGFALKQALMDNLKNLWVENINIESIIESAEMHLQYTCRNVNLESLKRMIKASKEIEWDKILADRLIAIRPIYIRGLIIAASLHIQNKDVIPEAVKINNLTEYWNLSDETKNKYSLKGYHQISVIRDKISKRKKGFQDFNSFILNEFGIQISKENDGLYINFSRESSRLRKMLNFVIPKIREIPKKISLEKKKTEENIFSFSEKNKNDISGISGITTNKKKAEKKSFGNIEPDIKKHFNNNTFNKEDFVNKAVELGLTRDNAANWFNKKIRDFGSLGHGYYWWR